jgi:Flp pilus assembly pilin Flp
MISSFCWIKDWLIPDEGQDLVEYSLLLGLLALAVVVALTVADSTISNVWDTLAASLLKIAAST